MNEQPLDQTIPTPLEIPTNKIVAYGEQGRGDVYDHQLDMLIKSIKLVGLLHPITVVTEGDQYRCLAGTRRLAACRALDWETIPATVLTQADKDLQVSISALENLDRKQLTPIEEANTCSTAIELCGSTHAAARAMNRSQSWIDRRMDILNWPQDCLNALQTEQCSMSAIAPLAAITDAKVRDFYLHEAIQNGATTRQTSAWYASWQQDKKNQQEHMPTASVVAPGEPTLPTAPTGVCMCCAQPHNLNELNHMPVCPGCLALMKQSLSQTPGEPPNAPTASAQSSAEG